MEEEKKTIVDPFLLFFFKDYTKRILKNNIQTPEEIVDLSVKFFHERRLELEEKKKRVLTKETLRSFFEFVVKDISCCNDVGKTCEVLSEHKFPQAAISILMRYSQTKDRKINFFLLMAIGCTLSSKTLIGSLENLLFIFEDELNGKIKVDMSLISCMNCFYEYVISEEEKIVFSSLLDFCHENKGEKLDRPDFEDFLNELEEPV